MSISNKASSCNEHWDNAQKIMNIWYLTPYKLSKMFPSSTPICWCCNNQTDSLYHMLWSCKNLSSFWNSVSSFITSLRSNLLKLNPAMALLNINLDFFPPQYKIIVANILIAARLTITKLWKSIEAPNLTDVISRLNIQGHYELMLARKKIIAQINLRNISIIGSSIQKLLINWKKRIYTLKCWRYPHFPLL